MQFVVYQHVSELWVNNNFFVREGGSLYKLNTALGFTHHVIFTVDNQKWSLNFFMYIIRFNHVSKLFNDKNISHRHFPSMNSDGIIYKFR